MKKIIILSVFSVSCMFAGIQDDVCNTNNSDVQQYSWIEGMDDDNFKADAGRRRGKGGRGKRRGGGGLR